MNDIHPLKPLFETPGIFSLIGEILLFAIFFSIAVSLFIVFLRYRNRKQKEKPVQIELPPQKDIAEEILRKIQELTKKVTEENVHDFFEKANEHFRIYLSHAKGQSMRFMTAAEILEIFPSEDAKRFFMKSYEAEFSEFPISATDFIEAAEYAMTSIHSLETEKVSFLQNLSEKL
ncbi:hypothetical protein HZA38_00310 [Candidatus Peregrinibacteria bacterium]|nr:hypothetical protein [Candidatus Peregrinibacteria bacterium]